MNKKFKDNQQNNQQFKQQQQQKKRITRFTDVDELKQRLDHDDLKNGEYLYDYKLELAEKQKDKMDPQQFRQKFQINFSDLAISRNTITGLNQRNFIKMTEIQRCTIPHALKGRDILGASKTGSGKTLSYLIPVVQKLYLDRWSPLDGLGALIIVPTRELVLNSITSNQELSIGLIIGGQDVQYEQQNIHKMNILVCTPGRLLQHMDESPGFDACNLKILVIDEADTIFQMGFAQTLNAILLNIPQNQQTLLFSATLSKNIQQLAQMNLQNPERIFLHDVKAAQSLADEKQSDHDDKKNGKNEVSALANIYETPNQLMQYYMMIDHKDKLDTLFSFLKSHIKSKVLVFFSTCKQVRFAYETFKQLRIGLPIMELHGRQKTQKRMAIFFTFSEKKCAALFTTNLASRGLDFPLVDWVIQVDIPEDTQTYVHRIGRTARFKSEGKSLVFVTNIQEQFLEKTKASNLNIHQIQANPQRSLSITATLQAYVSENINIKYLAQRAFISYLRCVFLSKDKDIFDVTQIDYKSFAQSLGLIQTPIVKFTQNLREESDDEQEVGSDNQDNSNENDEQQQEVQEKQQLQGLSQLKDQIKKKKEEKLKLSGKKSLIKAQQEEEDDDEDAEIDEQEEVQQQKINQNAAPSEKIENKSHIKHMKQIQRKNLDVFSEKFEKMREKIEGESDDELFVLQKRHQVEDIKPDRSVQLKVSKNQLKKVKLDGYFGGKNKILFDEDGQKVTIDQIRAQEYKKNQEDIEREDIDFTNKYKQQLIMNEDLDKENELARRKEKRLRKREQLREREDEKQGRKGFAVLGGSDEEGIDMELDEEQD